MLHPEIIVNVAKLPPKAVTKELICHTKRPTKDEIENLKNKLLLKKSASIKISSQIIEDGEVCVDFTGYYVIKI
jgi:hypothetical protein